MKKAVLLILVTILLIPAISEAQRWKRQRYEFSFGLGVSNFLGELGGANQIGTHYFRDLEWSMTRLAASVGLRYKLSNYFALKSHLTYGRVAGDDKLTTEFFRNYRNLNFYSDIYEFKEVLVQAHLFKTCAKRGFMGLGRACRNNYAVEVLLFYLLLNISLT